MLVVLRKNEPYKYHILFNTDGNTYSCHSDLLTTLKYYKNKMRFKGSLELFKTDGFEIIHETKNLLYKDILNAIYPEDLI